MSYKRWIKLLRWKELADLGSRVASHQESRSIARLVRKILYRNHHDGEARYLVFSWLTEGQADLRSKMLETMLDDSSPEIRYAAIAQAFRTSHQRCRQGTITGRLAQETARFSSSSESVVEIIGKLKEAGVEVHQANHFGFLANWKVIGPFDNVVKRRSTRSILSRAIWCRASLPRMRSTLARTGGRLEGCRGR